MIRAVVSTILPDLKELQESSIKHRAGEIIGWHTNVVLNNGQIIGSGTHSDQALARTIGLSEAIERRIVHKQRNMGNPKSLLLDEYPTTCGFAVGFDRKATKLRAVSEAVERWLRSQWIDNKFHIPEISKTEVVNNLSLLGQWMMDAFDEVRCFSINNSMIIDDHEKKFNSTIVVGFKGKGAFVGSRTCSSRSDLWTHALIEAWRHLIIYQNNTDRDRSDLKSVIHFGDHQGDAIDQIQQAHRKHFPVPKIRILKEVDTTHPGLFCFRGLCNDFRGWHGDDYWRFVY